MKRRLSSVFSKSKIRKKEGEGDEAEGDSIGTSANQVQKNLFGTVPPAEHLLILLSNSIAVRHYYEYVTRRFSSETFCFWACVEYYHCKVSENELLATHLAKDIYERFLKRCSPQEVNLENQQNNLNVEDPDYYVFDRLQRLAWELMVNSDYPGFMQSEEYQLFLGMMSIRRIMHSLTPTRSWATPKGAPFSHHRPI